MNIISFLVESGLAMSRTNGRDLIVQRGIKVIHQGHKRIVDSLIDDVFEGDIVIRGKHTSKIVPRIPKWKALGWTSPKFYWKWRIKRFLRLGY